jgi:hypothetical protein
MTSHATGPRSVEGKERSSLNATRHGLRSERPVIPGEDPAEWDAFRADIVADLDPAGTLERELADRIALQLWRLRRAARYEAEVVADEYEDSLGEMADALVGHDPNDPFWQTIAKEQQVVTERQEDHAEAVALRDAVPQLRTMAENAAIDEDLAWGLVLLLVDEHHAPAPVPTTAGGLRRALMTVTGKPLAETLALLQSAAEEDVRAEAASLAAAEGRFRLHAERFGRRVEARAHDQRLLQKAALDRVVRYEAHVSRQLNQARQMLREVQAERRAREETTRHAAPAPECAPVATPAQRDAVTTSSFGSFDETPTIIEEAVTGGLTQRCSPDPAGDQFVRQSRRHDTVGSPPSAGWTGEEPGDNHRHGANGVNGAGTPRGGSR